MGVIQNSLNTMLAAVMGGVAGAKHLNQQAKAVKSGEINELLNLQDASAKLETELGEASKNVEKMREEGKMYDQGKFKAFLPGDTENAVWIDKSFDQAEFDKQKAMQIKGLKISESEIERKGTRNLLMQKRIDELTDKYSGEITKAKVDRYMPDKKPNKEKGVF